MALEGQLWRLTSITSRAGPESVYNFEVAGEHVYYVGSDGLLVHNKYLAPAIKHARGFIKSQWSVVNGVLAKRVGRKLAGDHVLPMEAIKKVLASAGLTKRDDLYKQVMAFANGSKNLRLMDRGLNSSKWMRNAVRWSKTPQGSLVPRKFIQNILRKQYKNAQEINKILNNELKTNKNWFDDFFK